MSGVNRGALLRDITSRISDILSAKSRLDAAQEKLAKETETKKGLMANLTAAEAELAAVQRQKLEESSDDSELVELQRALTALTARRQDLIKNTKQARAERDKSKEDALIQFYARLGVEFERLRVEMSAAAPASPYAVSGSLPSWEGAAAELLAEAESLRKRASNQAVVTRELLDATLARAGYMLSPTPSASGSGSGSAGTTRDSSDSGAAVPPTVVAACLLYEHLPTEALGEDTGRSLECVAELGEAVSAGLSRCGAAADAATTERANTAISAVSALLRLVKQNVEMQRVLLLAVARALPPPDADGDEDEDSEGEGEGENEEEAGEGAGERQANGSSAYDSDADDS